MPENDRFLDNSRCLECPFLDCLETDEQNPQPGDNQHQYAHCCMLSFPPSVTAPRQTRKLQPICRLKLYSKTRNTFSSTESQPQKVREGARSTEDKQGDDGGDNNPLER